ncbi:hypothetical protein GCM10023176_38600 [Micromonospora coerulea]|uniref:Uncharacterized protein n=1 Tax=Micromonospora coerulea TaxID=47856 RepID=A0ABP8SPV0_9ACTN
MRGQPAEPGPGLFQEGVDARTHHVMEHSPIMPAAFPLRPANGPAAPQDPADGGPRATPGRRAPGTDVDGG